MFSNNFRALGAFVIAALLSLLTLAGLLHSGVDGRGLFFAGLAAFFWLSGYSHLHPSKYVMGLKGMSRAHAMLHILPFLIMFIGAMIWVIPRSGGKDAPGAPAPTANEAQTAKEEDPFAKYGGHEISPTAQAPAAATAPATSPKTEKTKAVKQPFRQAQNVDSTGQDAKHETPVFQSCPEELAPGVERVPVSLSPSELALVSARLVPVQSTVFVNKVDYDLKVHNGTQFCIIAIAVSVTIEVSYSSANRTLNKLDRTFNKAIEFSHPLAPGQEQHAFVDTQVALEGGGYENIMGLLKKWNLAEVRGFPAVSQEPPAKK